MTNDELQAAIEANTTAIDGLTGAVDVLVSRFIRPNAQQHLESMDRLGRIEQILERHAEAIATIDLKLDRIADQQTINAQQIEANTEAITQFDTRLEETRQLVAKNSSDLAQMSARVDTRLERTEQLVAKNSSDLAQMSARVDARLERTEQLVAKNSSDLAQMSARVDARLERTEQLVAENSSDLAQMGARMDARLERTDAQINLLIEENRAFRELQQSQLAAIIGNGRRIDRLEQQAN